LSSSSFSAVGLRALLNTAIARTRMGLPASTISGLPPAAQALFVAAHAAPDDALPVCAADLPAPHAGSLSDEEPDDAPPARRAVSRSRASPAR
jgi:hypothetical protein